MSKQMKVLFQIRPDYRQNPAGDSVQMLATAQGLSRLGVMVTISSDPNALLADYDLIHIFNLTRIRESYYFFLNAQKQGKKTVVSPIYWNPSSFLSRKEAQPKNLAAWNMQQAMRARLIKESDLLLPNGFGEEAILKQDFSAVAPCRVIPNGFPDSFSEACPHLIRQRFPGLPTNYVLCVARISPRKNQLLLAEACRELQLPLVLIGQINDRTYLKKRLAFPQVIYLGTQHGPLLASAYAAAKVHILPSWFETPGLSSLEAAACGTVVITTDQGCTKEYYLEHALYMNPHDKQALIAALQASSGHDPKPLTDHVRSNYPWSRAARETLDAYLSLRP
jgi:glycosyltransferase involved in cell wall biosynthesis